MSNKVVIRLTADNKELKRKLESARKDLGKFGKKSESVFKKISKSFGALGIAGGLAGLSYVLKNAIKGFAAFERTISIATNRLKDFSADAMKKVRMEITRLAKEGLGSKSELADALNFIAQTPKVTEENVNKTLSSIAKLAAATGDSMVGLADRVTDAMEVFGIAGNDIDLFSSKLIAVANQANTTVLQLATALQKSGGFRFLFSADEALAAASVLSRSYKSEEAGTRFQALSLGFGKQGTREALSERGIDIFRDGVARPFIEIIQDIAKQFKGTQEEVADFLGKLGLRIRARATIESLAENPEEFAKVIDLLSGTKKDLLDTLVPDDMQRQIDKFKGQLDELRDAVVSEGSGVITWFIDLGRRFLHAFEFLVKLWGELSEKVQVLVGAFSLAALRRSLLAVARWGGKIFFWVGIVAGALAGLSYAIEIFGERIRDFLHRWLPSWANPFARSSGTAEIDREGPEYPDDSEYNEDSEGPEDAVIKPVTAKGGKGEDVGKIKKRKTWQDKYLAWSSPIQKRMEEAYKEIPFWVNHVSSAYDKMKGIVEEFFAMERQNINQNYALAVRALDAEIAKRREAGEDEVLLSEEREKRLAELQAEKEEREKELFEKQKAFAIANVIISTMIGLANAAASIWSPANAGLTLVGQAALQGVTTALFLAQMAVSIAKIATQQYIPTAHSGGMVGAEGLRPLSNERDYRLEVGETVRTAGQEEALRGRFGGGLSMPLVNKISIDGKRFASIMSRIQEENRIS